MLHGDTQIAHKGLDTYGSRSLVVGGEALVKAADKVIEKAKPIAAHLLEASVDDIEFAGGTFTVKGTDQGLAIGEIAFAVFAAHNLPDGVEPSIDSEATYDPVNFNYPHGTHLCAMEVDTETGAVKMRKYVCVDDIGNIINPLIVAGQVHGGLVQGIAQALWEEAVYDDAGTLVSGSFVDYLLPTAADTISFDVEHTTTPSLTNTLGTKGVGEAGTIASTPAVVNAVVDAVRHLGVNDIQMPCTPERVWKAINGPRLRRLDRGCGDAALRERRRRQATRNNPARPAPKEQAHDPRSVRLRRADLGRGGPGRARRARRRGQDHRRRAEPAAGAPDAAQRTRVVIDLGKIESLRGVRDDGDAIVIGAMTPHVGGRLRPAGRRARAADHQGGRAPRRRPGAAPRHVRRRARARRPGRRPRGARRWRWARSS